MKRPLHPRFSACLIIRSVIAVFIYVELEPLCLVAPLRIDNLVKRTAGEGGNHLDDIVLLCPTGKYYFAFRIAKFAYIHISIHR